jgi:hypothetical protein
MQQQERDILIEVRTKVESLEKSIDKFGEKLDANSNDNDKLRTEIATLKPMVEENCNFRKWVWITLFTSLTGIIAWLVNLFMNQ